MIEEIAAGRTDRVFDYLAEGGSADSGDEDGVSLMNWCAYYGDGQRHAFSALPRRVAEAAGKRPWPHWRLLSRALEAV